MNSSPASFKTMILDKTIKRADAMKIEYNRIHVVPDFNPRDLDEQYEAEIAELLAHILAGGPLPPLEVVARADGTGVEIVDGHRRHDAMGRAIAQGFPIHWVSIVAFQGNQIDRMARVHTSNKNSQLRPMEAARNFKRFRGAGLDSAEIAAVVQCSRTHVENYLVLADAERDVQELVRACKVSAEVAIEAVRKLGASAGDFLAGKLGQATAAGKSKVTASTIHGRALPRKVVSPLISGVDSFMNGLTAKQRVILLDTLEGRVTDGTLTVSAKDLLELFQAHGAVEALRAKRAEKAAKEAQQAAPDTQAPIDLEKEEATA